MKKYISLFICTLLVFTCGVLCACAEDETVKVTTPDQLITIELPDSSWYQLVTDEHTEVFSDGSCSILIDLYQFGDQLPAIQTADSNHEFIYTAAVSSRDYIMLVVGYAHAKSDFSSMVKAINTIELDTDRITGESTRHETAIQYTRRDTWYTAWVLAERLNVRADIGTDAAILTTLDRDTRLTVTGIVLKDGIDIGWYRVRLENGSVGYVASLFLTTTEPIPAGTTKTGAATTLYTAAGDPVILYEYDDASWRTNGGIRFWSSGSGIWDCDYGDQLYEAPPMEEAPDSEISEIDSDQELPLE